MSDKGLLYKKRKNNHGSYHKNSRGSEFPRHDMNHYPGTHLGMRLRYQKPSVGRLYKGWNNNYGYIRTNRLTGFINKYIGKPYTDLVKAFYVLTKRLRETHKEVGLKDLEWHFGNLGYKRYKRWRGDYYVDDEGLVQVVRPEPSKAQMSLITNAQVKHNNKVKIPDFGRVTLPREVESVKGFCDYGYKYSRRLSYEKAQYKAPRFIGEYWCDIDGVILLLPVYHVPDSSEYAEYWSNTRGKSKPIPTKYYYGSYPKKWHSDEFCDKYADMYQVGTQEYKWALGMERGWVVPLIPFKKRDYYGLERLMYTRMWHDKKILLPNTDKLESARRQIDMLRERLALSSDPENYWHNKVDRIKVELELARIQLEKTPKMAYFNVGYGQLLPMVKRTDYEIALRQYEQEQKETNSEG